MKRKLLRKMGKQKRKKEKEKEKYSKKCLEKHNVQRKRVVLQMFNASVPKRPYMDPIRIEMTMKKILLCSRILTFYLLQI